MIRQCNIHMHFWHAMIYLPKNIIDADDALFVWVFGVAYQSGTGLHPAVAALLVHHSVIVTHHLALIQHWNDKINKMQNLHSIYGAMIHFITANRVELKTYSLHASSAFCEHLPRARDYTKTDRSFHLLYSLIILTPCKTKWIEIICAVNHKN